MDEQHEHNRSNRGHDKFTDQAVLMEVEELEIGDKPIRANSRENAKQQVTQDAEASSLDRASDQTGYNRTNDNLQH